jgi:hypothetical protein
MESFSADWLALREPADHAARAHDITAELAAHLAAQPRTKAVDLAGGTGSNIRYLLPRLWHIRHWTLIDHDPALLAVARTTLEPLLQARGVALETVRLDLGELEALPLDDCALVTSSALLDLVSADWLERFARRCREARAHVLCALNYDGRIGCEPRDSDDEHVRALVNRHQRIDKGFGPALGPGASAAAEAAFGGCEQRVSPSDWRLGAEAAALQQQLLDGWASAAGEVAPEDAASIGAWRARRLAHINAGRSTIAVGHRDLAVFPAAFA